MRRRFVIPDWPADRPKVPEAIPLRRSIYARCPVGCCLHVVLDDGNMEPGIIEWCLRDAKHDDCRALAAMMLRMSPTQRRRVVRSS